MRAVEQAHAPHRRLVDDPYAHLFLPQPWRAMAHPRWHPLPTMAVADRLALGTPSFVLLRHRFIDGLLREALEGSAQQVVVLGAGYDTRAYRFADMLAGRPIFEVDLPGTSRSKMHTAQRRASALPASPLRRVEIDFERASLADALLAAGLDPHAATFVVWEGVAPYLTIDAVRETLRTLASVLGPASVVAAEFAERPAGMLDPARLAMVLGESALATVGESVRFLLPRSELPGLMGGLGYDVQEVATGATLSQRYATVRRTLANPFQYVATLTLRPPCSATQGHR